MKLIPIANPELLGLGVGRRTVGRLIKNPNSGFPKPLRINGRLYVIADDIEAFKRNLIERSLPEQDCA